MTEAASFEQEDGSYIIAKQPQRMPRGGKFVPRMHDAEHYYWKNVLKREDELTVHKLDELYEKRNKGRESA